MSETNQTEPLPQAGQPLTGQPQVGAPQAVQYRCSKGLTEANMDVGLLVWSALLIIVGIILVIVPAVSVPSSVPLFQVSVVTLFLAAGIAFLGLAYQLARKGKPRRDQ